ncbi:bacteriocin [Listeria marthii]|nr:bacteriocin [Listeria marthii]UHP13686.1 bacteriocin [Listeria marthii]
MTKIVITELTTKQLENIYGGAKKSSNYGWWFWMFPTTR